MSERTMSGVVVCSVSGYNIYINIYIHIVEEYEWDESVGSCGCVCVCAHLVQFFQRFVGCGTCGSCGGFQAAMPKRNEFDENGCICCIQKQKQLKFSV